MKHGNNSRQKPHFNNPVCHFNIKLMKPPVDLRSYPYARDRIMTKRRWSWIQPGKLTSTTGRRGSPLQMRGGAWLSCLIDLVFSHKITSKTSPQHQQTCKQAPVPLATAGDATETAFPLLIIKGICYVKMWYCQYN